MTDYPLLLLPAPEISTRSSKHGGAGKYHYPDHNSQIKRLKPQFDQIINSIDTLQTIPGSEPELVLVIETIGSVADFIKAIEEIEGLDWLGELEEHEIEPSFDFYDETSKDKLLNGRLYMVMTNKTAMDKILSLWKQWETNKEVKLDHGLGRFKLIFNQLKNIKQWGIEDRLLETGILDGWNLDLQHGECPNKCEIELWFKNTDEKRKKSQETVEFFLKECGGKIITSCIIPEIAYHSLLVELPPDTIQKIIKENNKVELVKCNNIMFFRSSGQMMILEGNPINGSSAKAESKPLPSSNPIVALLDGYPMSNHDALKGRLIIDDPDDLASNY